jgi:hypothetical protein
MVEDERIGSVWWKVVRKERRCASSDSKEKEGEGLVVGACLMEMVEWKRVEIVGRGEHGGK